MRKVPTLDYNDYNNNKEKFVEDFYSGLKEYGFVVLKNHGIPLKLIAKVYEKLEEFFIQDMDTKKKYINTEIKQTGYIPFGVEYAKNKTPDLYDLKEFWQLAREEISDKNIKKYIPKNIWTEDKEFNESLQSLYLEFDKLSLSLLNALAIKLEIDKSYFKNLIKDGNSILRGIHYPPLAGLDIKGNIRAAAHEDINLITIMPGASETGLEILDKDGNWLAIEANYDYLIVDSGDMLARITNDTLKATTHRVVNPKDSNQRRLSLPFFVHPNPNAILDCIPSCIGNGKKYEAIRSIDFLNERLKDIGLKT